MTDKKYSFTEKELAEAIAKAYRDYDFQTGSYPTAIKLVTEQIVKNLNPPPPTLGPDYLGNMGYTYHIRRNIAAYLDGLIEEREKSKQWYLKAGNEIDFNFNRGALCGLRIIRTALCGPKEGEDA